MGPPAHDRCHQPIAARASSRRVAIVQSNYIPWKGYFDLINHVDEFVLLDEVQYTRRDWRNRNRIKTAGGIRWLTIPVKSAGRYTQRIDETRIAERGWTRSHWSAIEQAYRAAPHFEALAASLGPLYRSLQSELLSEVNFALLRWACEQLRIRTRISRSSEHRRVQERSAHLRSSRLLEICLATGASEYVSGPAARSYLDVELLERSGIAVSFFEYSGYRPYAQPHGAFEHQVSIIDLLFCQGPAASRYLKTTSALGAAPIGQLA